MLDADDARPEVVEGVARARRAVAAGLALWREGLIAESHVYLAEALRAALGAWSPIFALMVAFSFIAGDQEILFFFVVRMKAKYLVWIYIVLCIAILLKGDDRFGALTELSGALMGYVYTKFAPRRGMALGLSERYFGVRNDYYRWKRRRAAKKFQVYMRKQNREVHFDEDGRYVDPDELRKDPNDKRWMN